MLDNKLLELQTRVEEVQREVRELDERMEEVSRRMVECRRETAEWISRMTGGYVDGEGRGREKPAKDAMGGKRREGC